MGVSVGFLDRFYQSLAISFIAKKIGMSDAWVREGFDNVKVQAALVKIGKYIRSVNWVQLEQDLAKVVAGLPQ